MVSVGLIPWPRFMLQVDFSSTTVLISFTLRNCSNLKETEHVEHILSQLFF